MTDNIFITTTMAFQDGAPALAGQPIVAPTASTGEAGSTAAPAASKPADPFGMMWMLIPFLVIMVLVSVLGQRRDKKKRNSLMSSIKKHDEVQTAGGIIGSVVELKDDTVVLKIDENSNVRMTFAKSSIVQVIKSGAGNGIGTGTEVQSLKS